MSTNEKRTLLPASPSDGEVASSSGSYSDNRIRQVTMVSENGCVCAQRSISPLIYKACTVLNALTGACRVAILLRRTRFQLLLRFIPKKNALMLWQVKQQSQRFAITLERGGLPLRLKHNLTLVLFDPVNKKDGQSTTQLVLTRVLMKRVS